MRKSEIVKCFVDLLKNKGRENTDESKDYCKDVSTESNDSVDVGHCLGLVMHNGKGEKLKINKDYFWT